jgi:hypothetical protein
MKVYFLSSKPCILTLNGAYFGLTDTFERYAEISPKDNLFAEFTPENGQPIRFFLNENIRLNPPERCEIYLLKDGLAVYAKEFPSTDLTLRVIAQEREEDTLVTVFSQGGVQVSIENKNGFFLSTLPPSFEECALQFYQNFTLISSSTQIALYNQRGKRLLLENATSFSMQNGSLIATLPLSDSLNRTAECSWALEGETAKQTAFTIIQQTKVCLPATEAKESKSAIVRDEILPYAFLESALLGLDCSELLSEELKPKASALKEFLGDYESVVLTKNHAVCGLVRKKADRLFEVDEYFVDVEDGKIKDVQRI